MKGSAPSLNVSLASPANVYILSIGGGSIYHVLNTVDMCMFRVFSSFLRIGFGCVNRLPVRRS